MFTCTKTFKFEGAHVLDSSFSEECQNLHGHSYLVEVVLASEGLNADGMVMDFKLLKELVGPLFDDFDHALVVSEDSYSLIPEVLHKKWNIKCFKYGNPTAENMAKYFFDQIVLELEGRNVEVQEIIVHETKTGKVSYKVI